MNEASELRSDIQKLKADNTRLCGEENYLKAKLEATELRLRDANLQVAELESLARQSGMGYYHLITEELPEMVCATPRLAVHALIRKAKAAELQNQEYRKVLEEIRATDHRNPKWYQAAAQCALAGKVAKYVTHADGTYAQLTTCNCWTAAPCFLHSKKPECVHVWYEDRELGPGHFCRNCDCVWLPGMEIWFLQKPKCNRCEDGFRRPSSNEGYVCDACLVAEAKVVGEKQVDEKLCNHSYTLDGGRCASCGEMTLKR